MPTAEENSPPFTAADYYGFVLTGLFGVIDDAEASECNPEGIALLEQARDLFWAEFSRTASRRMARHDAGRQLTTQKLS